MKSSIWDFGYFQGKKSFFYLIFKKSILSSFSFFINFLFYLLVKNKIFEIRGLQLMITACTNPPNSNHPNRVCSDPRPKNGHETPFQRESCS